MLTTSTGVTEEYDERRHLLQECLEIKEESDAERALKRNNNASAQEEKKAQGKRLRDAAMEGLSMSLSPGKIFSFNIYTYGVGR